MIRPLIRLITILAGVSSWLVTLSPALGAEPVIRVTKIVVAGQEADHVEAVQVTSPGAENPEHQTLTLGQGFSPGTQIIASARTLITFTSSNGNGSPWTPAAAGASIA